MKIFFQGMLLFGFFSCMNSTGSTQLNASNQESVNISSEPPKAVHFKGPLTGGYKGDSIFFDVSANGKKLENLTFKGHWRCSGKIEQIGAVGPDGSFDIVNGLTKGHISDPPDGGATAWRFEIDAAIKGKSASGTFRMNINNAGCDTYVLKFSAIGK